MKTALLALSLMLTVGAAFAHSGGTNSMGCHYDYRTGIYHCH